MVAALPLLLASCGTAKDADTPNPSPSTTSAAPRLRGLDITGLKVGAEPRIAWVEGTTLHSDRPDVEMPERLSQVAVTKDHLVVKESATNYLMVDDRKGENAVKWPAGEGRLAINAKRNIVAWLTPPGVPMFIQDGEDEAVDMATEKGASAGDAIAVLGNDCMHDPETVEGAGCTVYFTLSDAMGPTPYLSSNHGFAAQADDHIHGLQDVRPTDRAFAGWTQIKDDMSTCSIVINENKTLNTCAYMPLSFSPDGSRLLATGSHGYEGLGTGQLSILDAKTGKKVLTLRNDAKAQATIVDMQWEDDDHVLAVVFQQGKWAILRVDTKGSAELAAKPVSGDETDIKYRLAVQP